MRFFVRAGLTACACLLLGGCYVSDTAFYGTSDAYYPFQAGAHYQHYDSNTNGSWDVAESGTLNQSGGWYSTTDDKGSASESFILKSWGQYAILEAAQDKGFIYDLIRIDGNTVYEYDVSCEDDNPGQLQSAGLIDRVDSEDNGFTYCNVTSPQALEQIMQRLLDSGAQPDSKYVIGN